MKADSICENECPSESKSEELSPSTSIHVSTRPTAQSGLFEEIEIFLSSLMCPSRALIKEAHGTC